MNLEVTYHSLEVANEMSAVWPELAEGTRVIFPFFAAVGRDWVLLALSNKLESCFFPPFCLGRKGFGSPEGLALMPATDGKTT